MYHPPWSATPQLNLKFPSMVSEATTDYSYQQAVTWPSWCLKTSVSSFFQNRDHHLFDPNNTLNLGEWLNHSLIQLIWILFQRKIPQWNISMSLREKLVSVFKNIKSMNNAFYIKSLYHSKTSLEKLIMQLLLPLHLGWSILQDVLGAQFVQER